MTDFGRMSKKRLRLALNDTPILLLLLLFCTYTSTIYHNIFIKPRVGAVQTSLTTSQILYCFL